MPACASSGVYVPRDTHRCDAAVLVRHHVARFLERVEEGSLAPLTLTASTTQVWN